MRRRAGEERGQLAHTKTDILRAFVHDPSAAGPFPIDRRVRKTREALRAALFDLIVEKGYEDVTVQDILDRADVGRSTFYSHFTDKEDAFRSGFDGLRVFFQEYAKQARVEETPFAFSLDLYRHCLQPRMRKLYAAMSQNDSATLVMRWLSALVADLVEHDLHNILGQQQAQVPKEALKQFIVSAYIGILRWAFTGTDDPSAEQMDGVFRALVMPALREVRLPSRHAK